MRGVRSITAMAAALLASTGVASAQTSDYGRLFHTPEQRRQLDQPSAPAPVAPGPAADTDPVRLDGIVRRNDGKTVIWVDGRTIDRPEAVGSVDGRSALVTLPDGRRKRVLVGESVMPGSGE